MSATPREIVALYERREAEAGGYAKADIKAVLRSVAEELGVTYEDARTAMLDEWCAGGSG